MRAALTAGLASAAALMAVCTACETESAAKGPKVMPEVTRLRKWQSQVFTASEGFDYRWSLSNETLGYLSNRTGPTTTYTSTHDPGDGNTADVTLVLTSFVEGHAVQAQADDGGTTNGVADNADAGAFERTAEAHILHVH